MLIAGNLRELRQSSGEYGELIRVLRSADERMRNLLLDLHVCDVDDAIKDVRELMESYLLQLRKPIRAWNRRDSRAATKIVDAIDSIVGLHKLAIPSSKIDFSTFVETGKTFRLDRRGLRSALNHLLLNSEEAIARHVPEPRRRGSIEVWARETHVGNDDFLEFSVADNGRGMTEEHLRLINSGSSLGWGTRTLMEITKLNCGYLEYNSVCGEGTIARIGLNLDLLPEVQPLKHRINLFRGGRFHAV